MEDYGAFDLVDACDGVALLVSLRIAARDEHHTDGSTFVELNGALVKVAGSHTLEEVDDVALQTQHDSFGLWVTHATVVFYDVGLRLASRRIGAVDESEEDKSLVVNAFGS